MHAVQLLQLYSLNLLFLESFLIVHFITKATPLIYIELLHKFTLKTSRTYSTSHTQSIHMNTFGGRYANLQKHMLFRKVISRN